MSFIDQMAGLRTSLNDTKQRTDQAVRKVKRDTNEIVRGARELVADIAQTQKANANQLRGDLERATQDLGREVKEMRGDNIRSQKELRRDFASARNVFWGKQKVEEEKEGEGKEE